MKKCKLFVLSGLIYALVLGMFPCETTQAASIKLSKKSLSLNVGKSKTLKIKNLKKGQKVKWSSSKKKVATVSSKGKVTARKKGTATITATVKGKSINANLLLRDANQHLKSQRYQLKSQRYQPKSQRCQPKSRYQLKSQ